MAKREVVVELQLGDTQAVARLGRLEIETKAYQRELRALNAEIARNGTATRAQTVAVGELNAKIRSNQTVIRELKNDLSGATAAGLRFRDKMAEASQAGLGAFGIQAVSVAAVTTAVIELGKEMFALAGEIEKVDARNRAIAGDSLPRFTAAAEANANALGLTAREYVKLAADQKLVLNQLGIEGSMVDDLSIKIVEYADLLGDFSAGTLTTEEATSLLNDALLGKTKGLKELGINVKASADELDKLKKELMESRGLTEEQASAVANLELAFRATKDAASAFGEETLRLDRSQDAATARLNEAKEALAQGLAPAFATVTEAIAMYTQGIANAAKSSGVFAAIGSAISPGLNVAAQAQEKFNQALIEYKNQTGFASKSTDELEARLKKLVDLRAAFMAQGKQAAAVEGDAEIARLEKEIAARRAKDKEANEGDAKRSETIGTLREKLKGLKEQLEEIDVTDTKGIATKKAEISALEARIKAIEGTTQAVKGATQAVNKLTEAQKAQLDIEAQLRADAGENIFAVTPGAITPVGQAEEEIEPDAAVAANFAKLTELREAFFESELTGLRDFNMERALLEAEYLNGSIASKEEYLRRAQAINDAEVSSELAKLQALANVSGALASLFGEQSAEAKAAATVQALINTYLGATQALSDKTIPNTFARIAAMASVIIAGLAQVKKIQGFAEGGFTSKRASNNDEVGVVHANEWVAPAWQTKHPAYAPVIQWLEEARRRRGMPASVGGYARGGIVRGTALVNMPTGPTMPAGAIANADLSRAIMNMPPPVVSVQEIRDVQGRVQAVERISRL